MTRFILLSGPSCVGKGPLIDAVQKVHKDLKFGVVGVIKSRESRPGGKLRKTDKPEDFFSADEIRSWEGDPRYIVGDCRGYPQAIDVERVKDAAKKHSLL